MPIVLISSMLSKCYIFVMVALAIVLFGGDSWGQSQRSNRGEEIAPPASQTANPKNDPAVDQHGTEQSPSVVKVLPTPQSDEQVATEVKRDNENAANERRLADFTEYLFVATVALALIAFMQLIVFGWQGIQLGRTVKATTASGEAFIAGERPYLYPEHPNYGGFLPTGAHAMYPTAKDVPLPKIEIEFANVGRTSGIIKEIRAEIVLDSLPEKPTFTYSPVRRRGEIIVRPDTITDRFVIEYSRNLTPDEIDEFGVGARPIFVFGYVKYADAFGLLNTKGFCFLNRLNKSPIELAGGRSYNYSRSEKIPDEYAT